MRYYYVKRVECATEQEAKDNTTEFYWADYDCPCGWKQDVMYNKDGSINKYYTSHNFCPKCGRRVE